jgi:hypothetical protein
MSLAATKTTCNTSTSSNLPNSELRKEFTRIQNETSELKDSVKSLSDELARKANAGNDREKAHCQTETVSDLLRTQQKILEAHERELRRNNLVMVGVEESEKIDLEVAKSVLLDKLGVDADIIETKRLGKKSKRRRPLLIKLPDHASKIRILKLRTKLKGSGIFINEDYTPNQRKGMSRLLTKMRAARSDGKHSYISKGVLFIEKAVSNHIPSKAMSLTTTSEPLEIIAIELLLKNPLIICGLYIPPNATTLLIHELVQCHTLEGLSRDHAIIVLGDLNMPDTDWSSLTSSSYPIAAYFATLLLD